MYSMLTPSGEMRQRIQVMTSTTTPDQFGDPVTTWSVSKTVWAKVEYVRGIKVSYDTQVVDQVTHMVYCRYFGAFSPDQRLQFNGKVFTILGINNLEEMNREYRISCQELVGVTLS